MAPAAKVDAMAPIVLDQGYKSIPSSFSREPK
eukprot:CAMPEP_0172504832 /NCGR_PEP_ID=MMETSP1066-20121228/181686_1 /TAXON_ID=671091 /ORGANISM="Coscinodiscus wailesii, Strain CCMP2513" /LENGTH=31 /DNA_ID= /DNA_START= /DNA_END= /DNA_ORIENTATION=